MSFFEGNLILEASCASGIEAILKRELLSLGYNPKGANYGRIPFEGNFLDVARSNFFLRTANRIRIIISQFEANTFDELYDGIFAINWKEIISKDGKIIVNAKSIKSTLFALSSIQSISKKAIVAKMVKNRTNTFFINYNGLNITLHLIAVDHSAKHIKHNDKHTTLQN